jgi:hypothetical protein
MPHSIELGVIPPERHAEKVATEHLQNRRQIVTERFVMPGREVEGLDTATVKIEGNRPKVPACASQPRLDLVGRNSP